MFALCDIVLDIRQFLFQQLTEEDLRSLMFGDYMKPDLDTDECVYEEVASIDDFYKVAEQELDEYNNTHKTRMNLVIFRFQLTSARRYQEQRCNIFSSW